MESVQLIPTLYLNEVHQLASRADMREIAAKLPTFQSARSLLYRARRKRLPASYATIMHWGSFWEWMGWNGKRFLLVEDGDYKKIIIFATDDNLKRQRLSLSIELSTHAQKCFIRSSLFMPSKMANSFHLLTAFYDKTHSSYQQTFSYPSKLYLVLLLHSTTEESSKWLLNLKIDLHLT